MKDFGISQKKILEIAKNNGIEDGKVIKAMEEIILNNNNEIKRYLENEYANTIKNNLAISMKRIR